MTNEKMDDEPCPCPGMVRKDGKCTMPDVTFTSFFMALNTSVLFHLGQIADPSTGKTKKDMLMAKHTIDTMILLQEKTKNNLTAEENDLVEKSLYDLKLRYVNEKSS